MMIIITTLILLSCLVSFKKSVLTIGSSLLFLSNLSSGIPNVKMLPLVCAFIAVLYFLREHKNRLNIKYPALIYLPCILVTVGYLISSTIGVSKGIPTTLVNAIVYFVYPYILFKMIDGRQALKYYLKSLFVFMSICAVYTLIELMLGYNIYVKWAVDNSIIEGIIGGNEPTQRFGFLRCNSFFPFSSGLGMVSAMTFYILFFVRSIKYHISFQLESFLFVMMPICVILCGTRSQMVVFVVLLVGLMFNNDIIRTKNFKLFVIVTLCAFLCSTPYFIGIVDSMVNSNEVNDGSSESMRLQQYTIALDYLQQAFWFGHGRNFLWDKAIPDNPNLFGAESVWLQLMIEYGVVGCATYLLLLICIGIWLWQYKKSLIVIPIAFTIGKTISIVAGIEVNYLIILSILYKKMELYCSPIFAKRKL